MYPEMLSRLTTHQNLDTTPSGAVNGLKMTPVSPPVNPQRIEVSLLQTPRQTVVERPPE